LNKSYLDKNLIIHAFDQDETMLRKIE